MTSQNKYDSLYQELRGIENRLVERFNLLNEGELAIEVYFDFENEFLVFYLLDLKLDNKIEQRISLETIQKNEDAAITEFLFVAFQDSL